MASVTFTIPDDVKAEMKQLSWINWSELARETLLRQIELDAKLKRVKELLSKSQFTEKDAMEMADKVSKSIHDSSVKEGLI
ncbi:MAG: hypothetical protein V1859_06690 [archaeon]